MENHTKTLGYGEQQNTLARQQNFCYIFYIKKYKDSNTLLNTLARKEHLSFLA
jgi:hypothetical protein